MNKRIAPLGIGLAAMALSLNAAADPATLEQDHAAILGMSGGYAVDFNFEEIITLPRAEEASEPHHSQAHELVLVLEDRPGFISMQHLLVVGEPGSQDVVKHWRQDWEYEPATVLEYQGGNEWAWRKLSRKERAGAWSQTVYQVADTPRYSGVAPWHHQDGYSWWESKAARPLPRRESKRKDYDLLDGLNRHGVSSTGWTHEQDNAKVVLEDGQPVVLGRERGFNTYTKDPDFDFAVATTYWDGTKAFWAETRDAWAKVMDENDRLYIAPRGDGLQLFTRVFNLANDYSEDKVDDAGVREKLGAIIGEHVKHGKAADAAGQEDLVLAKQADKAEAIASAK
ncbi:MAG: hypothetical protein GC168_16150 [Candidatus Hydrogenedens sp.]|nr:hypothetical protein [Candidatus Hydrogenedens sp.]